VQTSHRFAPARLCILFGIGPGGIELQS
jgi:hypothetical protein